MAIHKSWREESKKNYGSFVNEADQEKGLRNDVIQIGAILRIADAAEKMAGSYDSLIREKDRLKRDIQYQDNEIKIFRHRIAGLKGYIKRMKK